MKTMPTRYPWLGVALTLVCTLCTSTAEVKMPRIFGNHMVLQQESNIPIWGTASPGEKVRITLADQNVATIADKEGNWHVSLAPIPANSKAQKLIISGTNTLQFDDVLIGDVWICSGQSNMEFGINNDSRGPQAIAQANAPAIRLFMVPKQTALSPLTKMKSPDPKKLEGAWQVCSPETLGGSWGWNGFSAVGYYFAQEIHQTTGRPVGMIGSYWGGTPAQAWMSLDALQKEPALAHYAADSEKLVANYQQALADYPKLRTEFDQAMTAWNKGPGKEYSEARIKWAAKANEAHATGQPIPRAPVPSQPKPARLIPPDGGPLSPTTLYNGMIAPLIPYAIKGAIWYQGESNVGQGMEYRTLFPTLITNWRKKWKQGEFPFLFVQLANMGTPEPLATKDTWPLLRESQLLTLALPQTGMAVAIDIGNPFDVHPADKLDVGHRLALAARHVAYGEDIVYSGPLYSEMKITGSKIRLSFKNTGSGLIAGAPPWTPSGHIPKKTSALAGFAIAGADQKWFIAQAQIEGDTVIVSSDQVPAPVAVRYNWSNAPSGNLYNKEELPATPFRTDTWEYPTPQK